MITTNETQPKKEDDKEREVRILTSNKIQPKEIHESKEIKPAGTGMITTGNIEKFQRKPNRVRRRKDK